MKNDLDLAAIKAREHAATPGPWTVEARPHRIDVDGPDGGWILRAYADSGEPFMEPFDDDDFPAVVADAEFVAHARMDVPRLVAEVERLRRKRRKLRAEIARLTSVPDTGDTGWHDVGHLILHDVTALDFSSRDDWRVEVTQAPPLIHVAWPVVEELLTHHVATYDDNVLTVNATNGTFRYRLERNAFGEHIGRRIETKNNPGPLERNAFPGPLGWASTAADLMDDGREG